MLTAALTTILFHQELTPISPGTVAQRQAQIIFVRVEKGQTLATTGARLLAKIETTDGRVAESLFSVQAAGYQALLRLPARVPTSMLKRFSLSLEGRANQVWDPGKVTVFASDQGREVQIAKYDKFDIKVEEGKRWTSPIMLDAVDDLALDLDDYELEVYNGSDTRRRGSVARVELETVDGQVIRGIEQVSRFQFKFQSDSAITRLKPSDIALVRIGFTSGTVPGAPYEQLLATDDVWEMKGFRLFARAPLFQRVQVLEMPAINHRFEKHGWYQSPSFRRFSAIRPSETLRFLNLKVLTGFEDLQLGTIERRTPGDSRLELYLKNSVSGAREHIVNFTGEPSIYPGPPPPGETRRPFPYGWTGSGRDGGVLERRIGFLPEIAERVRGFDQLEVDYTPGRGDRWTLRGLGLTASYTGSTHVIQSNYAMERRVARPSTFTLDLKKRKCDVEP